MKYLIDKPDYGRKIEVYRNLSKNVYSIRDAKTKRVIHYANEVYLQDVTFKVSESGRKRVIRDKRKNVHAFVVGTWLPLIPLDDFSIISYNPYKNSHFYIVNGDGKWNVLNSKRAHLTDEFKITIGGEMNFSKRLFRKYNSKRYTC